MPSSEAGSLHWLNQAIALAEREFELLEADDCLGLAESADARQGLLDKAWGARLGCTVE